MFLKLRRLFSTALSRNTKWKLMDPLKFPELFLPPVSRSMKILDRSFFQKTVDISAAVVTDIKQIANLRKQLEKSGEILKAYGISPIQEYRNVKNVKCILLSPQVKRENPQTWSPLLAQLTADGTVRIEPYTLQLTYDTWPMAEILNAVLPEFPEDESETPAGFAQVGHVAHVNLKDQYLPYKHLIGEILADKNPSIKTVINKTKDVGTESVYRTFPYEVLAGPDDLNVNVSFANCSFVFNFAEVYWNTRLSHEHERLVDRFKPGETVCDVMAGCGPFALPAAKRGIFVWANDLNPACFESLVHNIEGNRLTDWVTPSCADGRDFIRKSAVSLPKLRRMNVPVPGSKQRQKRSGQAADTKKVVTVSEPPTFDHYIMNLPASAVSFLDAFQALYHGRESEFAPHTERKLPMIHVYTFQARLDTEQEQQLEVCKKVSGFLGAEIKPGDEDVEIVNARLVAPKKWYYCVSFRLPASVAFASPPTTAST